MLWDTKIGIVNSKSQNTVLFDYDLRAIIQNGFLHLQYVVDVLAAPVSHSRRNVSTDVTWKETRPDPN